jgi:hypothetical protein
MYVKTFKTDIIVFGRVKCHNVMSHWLILSNISQYIDTDYQPMRSKEKGIIYR